MAKCRSCSYEPAKRPRVFCPACGDMWDKTQPPKAKRREPKIDKKPVGPEKAPTKKKAVAKKTAAKKTVTKTKKGN